MIEVTAEVVREFLDYNPETGEFRWKARDRKWFNFNKNDIQQSWNARYAGTVAGSIYNPGYRMIRIFKKHYQAHRLAWLHYYGEWPQNDIDHINHIKDDNRIKNLRDVTRSQNSMNASIQSGTSSQYKGVTWDKRVNKWQAYITLNREFKYLGLFTIEKEAARAYDRAALEHFGIYANLNFPIEDYLDYIEELAA